MPKIPKKFNPTPYENKERQIEKKKKRKKAPNLGILILQNQKSKRKNIRDNNQRELYQKEGTSKGNITHAAKKRVSPQRKRKPLPRETRNPRPRNARDESSQGKDGFGSYGDLTRSENEWKKWR